MDRIWLFIKEKWKGNKAFKAEQPFIHESIDFENFPESEFWEWKEGSQHRMMKSRMRQAYLHYSMTGDATDKAFEFWNTPMSKGFILWQRESYRIARKDFLFWQYDIHIILKERGYTLNLAERRSHQKGHTLEYITKYYLKPSTKNRLNHPAKQLFGNISIEYIEKDDLPYMLRTLANYYQAHNYAPPQPFEDFIQLITA